MKFFKLKAVRWGSLLLLFCISFFIIDKFSLAHRWLRMSHPVDTRLLIVEDWVPSKYYPEILNEFNKGSYENLLITGIQFNRPIKLYQEGAMVLIPQNQNRRYYKNINIRIKGNYAGNEYSHCIIKHNDSILWSNYVEDEISLSFKTRIEALDSLKIEFTNDYFDENSDRNLEVKEITIDSLPIDLYTEEVHIYSGDNKVKRRFLSYAGNAVNKFEQLGIPKEKISIAKTSHIGISKTYSTARAASNWMKSNHFKNANIITLDYHSRRTYLSLKKNGSGLKVGIIPIDSSSSKLRTSKEITGNLVIFLLPKAILDIEII